MPHTCPNASIHLLAASQHLPPQLKSQYSNQATVEAGHLSVRFYYECCGSVGVHAVETENHFETKP